MAQRILLLTLLFFGAAGTLSAQLTWTGASGTDWGTASNWSPAGVPSTTTDVIIPNTTNKPVVSAAGGQVKTVTVQNGGVLTIAATANLFIFGSGSAGILNLGTVNNNGIIDIGQTGGATDYGIQNSNVFNNNAGAQLNIDGCNIAGIYAVSNTFNNAGTIAMGNWSSVGALLTDLGTGTLSNNTGGIIKGAGTISTSRFTNAGGSLGPEYWDRGRATGIITFNAAVNFANTPLKIDVNGTTANILYDQIAVAGAVTLGSNLAVTIGYTPADGDEITFLTGSSITGTFNSITGVPAGWSVAYFPDAVKLVYKTNYWTGRINTDWNTAGNWSIGIVPAADQLATIPDVTNDPVISTAGSVAKFLKVLPGGALTIATTGVLTIAGGAAFDLDSSNCMVNQGTVVNNGTITIANLTIDRGFSYGINNAATFTNAAGATININGITTGLDGLLNQASGTFTNSGTISIGATGDAGARGIENIGTFNNNTGGLINIDRARSVGLYNNGILDNFGILKIGANAASGNTGIRNLNNFRTESGSQISIDQVISNGLANSGVFDNSGSLKIGSLTGGNTFTTGISNSNTCRNLGGPITIDRVTTGISLTSNMDNYRTITIGELASVATMIDGSSFGKFINNTNGILKGSGLIKAAGYSNNGGKLAPGTPIGIMSFNGSTSINGGGLEIDLNGTATAGTSFDQLAVNGTATITGTLSVNQNYTPAIGDEVTIISATTISGVFNTTNLPANWYVNYKTDKVTLSYGVTQTTWTGAVNTDWNNAGNWSAGIPNASMDITIPNVTNSPVVNDEKIAKSITVQTGASLTISSTGSLTINGSTTNGLLNLGTVNNNGVITLGNTAAVGANGIRNEGTFNNNTGSQIKIDRVTTTNIFNVSGTFTNAGTITIGANAASGTDGIDNYGVFNNNTGAQIFIDRVTSAGIYQPGTGFTNQGNITIGSLSSGNTIAYGIYTDNIFNNTGGQINIDRVTTPITVNANAFNNTGAVTIGKLVAVTTMLSATGSGSFSNNTGGEFKGTGTIDAARFVNNGGKLSPGYSPGKLTFTGNETFVNSTLNIELAGTAVAGTDFDQVAVNGTATLGGDLTVTAINGFAIKGGQSFVILTGTSVTGTFASVSLPAGVTGSVTYTSTSATLNILTALPLTLIEFTGEAKGDQTLLKWKTADEENTSVFEIERSSDGVNHAKIGSVTAMGDGAHSYSFTDDNPAAGNNYYRLKMVDRDGKFTYSKLVLVKFIADGSIQITPVPANSFVKLTITNQSLIGQPAQIYNSAGVLVTNIVLTSSTQIDISSWPNGIYNIKTGTGTFRFIKQ
ncbi:beta strand repeat-containing protein [Niastella yeongjuensis]|nr:T9SS type A sorting domain-containing protein [Niastella yeongjuensis]